MLWRNVYQRAAGIAAILVLVIVFHPATASAGTILGVDVQDYIVIYQGGNSGSQLSINNFGTTGIWTGDIGIAGAGKLAASGPGTVAGTSTLPPRTSGRRASRIRRSMAR